MLYTGTTVGREDLTPGFIGKFSNAKLLSAFKECNRRSENFQQLKYFNQMKTQQSFSYHA